MTCHLDSYFFHFTQLSDLSEWGQREHVAIICYILPQKTFLKNLPMYSPKQGMLNATKDNL